jgi:EmrB/QacA subfamily drug resistance transporter
LQIETLFRRVSFDLQPTNGQSVMSRRTQALLAICGGVFLAFLDTTIVNTSFPDIRRGFAGATPSQLSWVLDGYFIVLAALLVPAGGVADRLGRKRVFLGGLALFVMTSVLCAIAPTWELLVAARVLQGVGAAIMVPSSLALLLPLFSQERRSAGVGIWGAAAALAAAVGPPLGGLLVEVADWRWIFLVNLPLGAAVLLMGTRALDESRDPTATGLPDLAGAALAAVSLGLLALGLVEGNTWGWESTATLGSFAGAAALLTAVVVRSRTHPRPIVDLELLRIPSFRQGTLGTLLFAAAFFSMILGNILFLTGVWGYNVLTAGLSVAPGPLASAIVAGPAGSLADRWGHRAVIVPGTLFYVAGLLILRSAGLEPDYAGTWLPGQLLIGIGIGLAFPTLGAAAAADIPEERFGVASAVTGAGRQLGAVLGTALLIAIVGQPQTLVAASHAADNAYVFGISAALLSGLVALRIKPARAARARALEAPAVAVVGPVVPAR